MKRLILVFSTLLSTVLVSAQSFAQGMSTVTRASSIDNTEKMNQTGIGAQVGAFNGINIEHWYSANATLNATVADERGNPAVLLSHNWMFRNLFPGWAGALTPYAGLGLVGVFGSKTDYFDRTDSSRDFAMAVQVPIGVEWLPRTQRFSIFGQISPNAQVIPVLMGVMNADVGARFYF